MERSVGGREEFPLNYYLFCVDSLIDREPPTEISAMTAKKFITALHDVEVYPIDISNNLQKGIVVEYKRDEDGSLVVHCDSEGGILVESQREDGERVLCYMVSLNEDGIINPGADLSFPEALSFIKESL